MLTSLEICAGAGGQALGLEKAGFSHSALVEFESEYCQCLKENRPEWNVICSDVRNFDGTPYKGKIDLLSGGVPCPPFSIAGKQLGSEDERDLFPEMLRLVKEINPRAVMIENVRGLLDDVFTEYRNNILATLESSGYHKPHIQLLNASDYGVPQSRQRVIIVAIREDIEDTFIYPNTDKYTKKTVADTLSDLMNKNGWKGFSDWKEKAAKIAPTVVGGSKKHGGPDLGPVRARNAWALLGIDGKGIANESPEKDFEGMPRLTPRMLARVQGFPDEWKFGTKKTAACRMIGNALPPQLAEAVGIEIKKVLEENANINIKSA